MTTNKKKFRLIIAMTLVFLCSVFAFTGFTSLTNAYAETSNYFF